MVSFSGAVFLQAKLVGDPNDPEKEGIVPQLLCLRENATAQRNPHVS